MTQRGALLLCSDHIAADLPTGRVEISQVGGDFSLAALLDVAARRNAARGYLLVSRVLGKHLPVSPARMAETHEALAARMPAALPGPVAFVGMAETATGVGLGVYEAWRRQTGREDAVYLHTTRYPVRGYEALAFEEAHSHGPSQVLCLPAEGPCRARLRAARTLVVVDDEVTTGRTAQGLAAVIEASGVPIEQKVMVALVADGGLALDGWDLARLAAVRVSFTPSDAPAVRTAPQGLTVLSPGLGSQGWGRVGALAVPALPEALLKRLAALCAGAPVVYVIGSGECMHPAFVLGRALEARGLSVLVQASTRSPVLVGAAIARSLSLEDGLGSGVPHFVHNPPPEGSVVLALHEAGAERSVRALMAQGAHPVEVWDA